MVNTLISTYFGSPLFELTIKPNCMKLQTVDSAICPVLIFSKKCLGLVFPLYFMYDYWREIIFLLYSTRRPNFIVWLLLPIEISDNMCIVSVSYPVFVVKNFEIYLCFLIMFSYMTTNLEQILKYLKNEKNKKSF